MRATLAIRTLQCIVRAQVFKSQFKLELRILCAVCVHDVGISHRETKGSNQTPRNIAYVVPANVRNSYFTFKVFRLDVICHLLFSDIKIVPGCIPPAGRHCTFKQNST